MNDRLRGAAIRALPLLALAALLTLLVASSSLQRLFPSAIPAPILFLALALLLVPALLATRSPLPAMLAIAVPALALASYDQSRLDWLRTLKDFGVVARSQGANVFRVALELAALALVFAIHAADHAARLRASAVERGVPRAQARASMRIALGRSAQHGALALLGALVVGALALAAAPLDLSGLLAGRAALIVPLVAIALVAIAAIALAGGRGDDARTTEGTEAHRDD